VELATNITLDEGTNNFGVNRKIILEGDQVVEKTTYDAEPLIEAAARARIATAGDKWGDGHFVGVIPYAELARINEIHKGSEARKHAILSWLRDNPKLVTFEKFLK
jgi:hypothetical protein